MSKMLIMKDRKMGMSRANEDFIDSFRYLMQAREADLHRPVLFSAMLKFEKEKKMFGTFGDNVVDTVTIITTNAAYSVKVYEVEKRGNEFKVIKAVKDCVVTANNFQEAREKFITDNESLASERYFITCEEVK